MDEVKIWKREVQTIEQGMLMLTDEARVLIRFICSGILGAEGQAAPPEYD